MSYLDKYIARDAAYGSSEADRFKNATINNINDTFKDSPFYKQISIAGTLTDTRISTTDLYNERNLLFKPTTTVAMGAYCTIDTQSWIISESFTNDIYPKAKIVLCNETLKWKDKSGTVFSYACSVNRGRGALNTTAGGTFDIQLPNGYVFVDVQLNVDTKTMLLNQRFILNGRVYKISGIDNITQTVDGVGMLKLTMEPDTSLNTADDKINGYADNSVLYGGSAAGTTTTPTGSKPW